MPRSTRSTLLAIAALQCIAGGCSAWLCEDTETYYKPLEGLEGAALEASLTAVVKQEYKSLSYASAWNSINILDEVSDGMVSLIYSDDPAPTQTGCPGNQCVWTREHLWPQSYGVDPNDSDNGPSYSDLHNLFAVVNAANGDRSNDIFAQITSSDNKCLPDFANCEVPAHSSSSSSTAEWDNTYWQPPADRRGDIARVLFYMQVRYDGVGEKNTADLQLVEDPPLKASNEEPSTRVFGILSTLLQWHCDDPVSDKEKRRNDAICKDFQHNRNPFVDDPTLVEKVFTTYKTKPSCFGNPPTAGSTPAANSSNTSTVNTTGTSSSAAAASLHARRSFPWKAFGALLGAAAISGVMQTCY
mmetsp:Transcript_3211/g.6365  ORF Transcript_3211/g.6365 Transcript_3211/m.6365 type:complete len:357 (-) Transcript_3211:136-1206(-)